MDIEFISYDGTYPTLCFGTLVVALDGRKVAFGDTDTADFPAFWTSGGSVSFNEDWDEEVTKSDWEMSCSVAEKDYPPDIWKALPAVLDVMNANVQHGCCGGCV